MNPKKYLKDKKITIKQAAKEIGISRPHLTDVLNKKTSCGKKLAENFEKWTNGKVSKFDLLYPDGDAY